VIGLVGVSRDLKMPDVTSEDFEHISAAVHYAEAHIGESPTNADLANIACMSPYQLDRRMKRVFGMPMGQWLLKTRISRAGRQLVETRLPIVEVALNAGYTDQSAFTRQFRRATGLTPSQFRRLRVGVPEVA
jgi:AraC-like DNA-binding protein